MKTDANRVSDVRCGEGEPIRPHCLRADLPKLGHGCAWFHRGNCAALGLEDRLIAADLLRAGLTEYGGPRNVRLVPLKDATDIAADDVASLEFSGPGSRMGVAAMGTRTQAKERH